jgi:HEAT repeat protein
LDRIEELIADLDAFADSRYRLAIQDLVRIGEPAVESLCRALTDAREGGRGRAAEVLGRLGRREALPALRERLRTMVGERAAQVRPRIWAAIMWIENAEEWTNRRPRIGDADTLMTAGRPRRAEDIDMPGVSA